MIEGQIVYNGQISIPLGGKHATQHLCNLLQQSPPASATTSQLLPPSEITFDLAEEIKLSPITEITTQATTNQRNRNRLGFSLSSSGESTPLGTPDARDEGVDDIAQIVASGRMSEYFEKKEREKAMRGKKGETIKDAPPQKPNAELPHNTLQLKSGTSILVGGERFRVAETLMEGITEPLEEIVMGLPDAVTLAVELACRGEHSGKRADLWQHMVIVGGGARIKGPSPFLLPPQFPTPSIPETHIFRLQRSLHSPSSNQTPHRNPRPRRPHPRLLPSLPVRRCRHPPQWRHRR